MALESATYIGDLNVNNPDGADGADTLDQHDRLIKTAVKNCFPGFTGAVIVGGTTGGSATAYTLSPTTALPSYVEGMMVVCEFHTANTTTTPTLNISGLGAKTIVNCAGGAVLTSDLASARYTALVYDGTNFQLLAVTKNYADQLAFNTVLPAQSGRKILTTDGTSASWQADQTGNGGKFLTTNGTNISWDYAGISTVGATVTNNYTIVGVTPTIWPCATTAIGKSLTAPAVDANTPLGLFAVIDNKNGGYPVGWRDSAGTLIMAVAPGGIGQVYLEANGTAAGTWRITGTNLEPGLITIDSTFSSTYASTVLAPFVALDANTSIHFAAITNGFAAFVVDNTGKVLSTPVTVASGGTRTVRTAFKVSSTSAIVFYDDANNNSWAAVLTLTGSTPSYSLSVGTAAVLTSATQLPWIVETFSGIPKVAQLSSTLYVASFTDGAGGNTSVLAVSVSGATVTIGAVANIITANMVANSTTTYALTATTALVLYKSGVGAPYANNAVVVSVSGTTCTVGTPAALTNVASSSTGVPSSCQLSATKVLVGDDNNSSGTVRVSAFTVSGTTVTAGTHVVVETGISTTFLYTDSSATRYNPHLFPLSSSTALLWYKDANPTEISRAVVLSESGGTVTAGTILYRSISGAGQTVADGGAILPQGTTEVCVLRNMTGAPTRLALETAKISGTTIAQGASAIPASLTNGYGNLQACARMSTGKYVLHGYNNNSATGANEITVFSSNGDALALYGSVKVPAVVGSNIIGLLPAVASNRIVLLGATTNGTTVGASTNQLRILNLEIAA